MSTCLMSTRLLLPLAIAAVGLSEESSTPPELVQESTQVGAMGSFEPYSEGKWCAHLAYNGPHTKCAEKCCDDPNCRYYTTYLPGKWCQTAHSCETQNRADSGAARTFKMKGSTCKPPTPPPTFAPSYTPTPPPTDPSPETPPSIVTTAHRMNKMAAMSRPWTWRVSGNCGKDCKQVRRSFSASCQNRLFTVWTAHVSWGERNDQGFKEITEGRISEFTIADDGKTTKVHDTPLPTCDEMGEVVVTSDCAVIAAVCQATALDSGAKDLVTEFKQKHNMPWGWDQPNNDNMYLLEWTSKDPSKPPNSKLRINHSIAGWVYGHFDIQLNKAQTVYAIDLKTNAGGHEGSTNFAINRPTQQADWSYNAGMSKGWGCGTGHVLGNQVVYNEALDEFGRYCRTDNCAPVSYDFEGSTSGYGSYGTFFGTYKASDGPRQLECLPPAAGGMWNGNGGGTTLLSRGSRGFMGQMTKVATLYDDKKMTIGIARLPVNSEDCLQNGEATWSRTNPNCQMIWLNPKVLRGGNRAPGAGGISFSRMQHVGPGGEEGTRYMVGYASNVQFQGYSSEYYVFEMDEGGQIWGGVHKLQGTGWGEEDSWVPLDNGCIAFSFFWNGEAPGHQYEGDRFSSNTGEQGMSNKMHVTVLCPNSPQSATSPAADQAAQTKAPTTATTPAPSTSYIPATPPPTAVASLSRISQTVTLNVATFDSDAQGAFKRAVVDLLKNTMTITVEEVHILSVTPKPTAAATFLQAHSWKCEQNVISTGTTNLVETTEHCKSVCAQISKCRSVAVGVSRGEDRGPTRGLVELVASTLLDGEVKCILQSSPFNQDGVRAKDDWKTHSIVTADPEQSTSVSITELLQQQVHEAVVSEQLSKASDSSHEAQETWVTTAGYNDIHGSDLCPAHLVQQKTTASDEIRTGSDEIRTGSDEIRTGSEEQLHVAVQYEIRTASATQSELARSLQVLDSSATSSVSSTSNLCAAFTTECSSACSCQSSSVESSTQVTTADGNSSRKNHASSNAALHVSTFILSLCLVALSWIVS